MVSLFQSVNYVDMNTTDTTRKGYDVIKFVSEAYTLQDDTTCDIQISSFVEIIFKLQYPSCMKEK